MTQEELHELEYVPYGNTGTYAYFDGEYYYNQFGQSLRNPVEYNEHAEGYTPFGDE